MRPAHDNAPVTRRQEFAVLAIDRLSGKTLWKRILRKGLPHAGAHKTGTLASASPVTDGEHLLVSFGSQGLYCLDLDGELQWQKDLGDMQVKHGHGEGSSPVLHGETVVVNWDHEGQSFLVALDKRSGKELWRALRNEVTSWSTPIVVADGDSPQVIVSGTKRVRGYDLRTGEVIWECGGLSHNIVASPVAADGMVFVASSYEKRAMLAIRLDGAEGDITGTDRVAWVRRRRTPYIPSPLLYRGWLYFLSHYQGILSRVKAETGEEPHGPFRLRGMYDIYASPVAAAGRVYITDRDGTTAVLGHGADKLEVLAVNRLEDSFSASAAVAGKELYLRGERYLYCIAKD
ncbi:MAG: PQQ-binding-like beta-propeller repeat protein [Myxococcota bacterium]